jgi:hypothetical protein
MENQDGMERKDLLEKNCGIFKEQVNFCAYFVFLILIYSQLNLVRIHKTGWSP